MNTSVTKGVIYGAMAAACYGTNPLFTLPLYKAGLTSDSVLFYRYGLATLFLGIYLLMRKTSFRLPRHTVLPLGLLGLLFSISSLTLFISYHYLDAGVASTILFVYPLMVALLMAVFFKERLTPLTCFSLLLATVGIGLLCKTESGGTLSLLGIGLVLLSSLSYAIYMIGINRPRLQGISPLVLTFYALLTGVAVFAVRLKVGFLLQPLDSWLSVGCALGLSLLPTLVSLLALTQSIRYIGATPAAILGALEPVTALVIGVFLFHEHLTPRMLLGIALILLGVLLVVSGKEVLAHVSMRLHLRHR